MHQMQSFSQGQTREAMVRTLKIKAGQVKEQYFFLLENRRGQGLYLRTTSSWGCRNLGHLALIGDWI